MSSPEGPEGPGDTEERQPRGVHNPHVIDLITDDPSTGEVVLVMLEQRPWGTDPEQLRQLEAKFNSYLEYVLGGHMAKQYPQYAELPVRFQIDCAGNPPAADRPFFTSMANFAAGENIRMVIGVMQPAEPGA